MKPKIIIIAFSVFLLFAGLFLLGYVEKGGNMASVQGVGGSHPARGQLVASELSYDFGTISMKNGNVQKEFTITNSTSEDINLKTVVTSCMCTQAFIVRPDGSTEGPFGMPGMGYVPPANDVIKAGESRVIRAVYDPNAHGPAGVGQINRFITLTDASGGTLELEIKALVKP